MLRRNNTILNAAYLILFCVLYGVSINSQTFSNDEKRIIELQDTRTAGTKKELISYLISDNTENSYLAALALGNIGDASFINELGTIILKDVDSYVSHNSAFALGQIVSANSPVYLVNALKKNAGIDNKIIREFVCELLNSLGKIGSDADFNEMLKLNINDPIAYPYIAMAIARFGMRKIKSDDGFKKLAEMFEQTADSTLRRYVAYAFNRAGDKYILQAYNTELVIAATSPDPLSRMWAISAIGRQQDTSSIEFLIDVLSKENDWRVKVNTVNALGAVLPDLNSPLIQKLTDALIDHALNDNSTHVSIVSWQVLGKLFAGIDTRNPLTRKIQQEILFVLTPGKAIDWQVKAEVVRTYAKIFKGEAKDDLIALFKQTDNYDIKSAIAASFGSFEDPMVYKELRQMISDDVMKYNEIHPNKDGSMIGSNDLAKLYRGFVSSLTELDDKMDEENRNIIRLIYSEFASSKDAQLTDICLSNLQDSIYEKYRNETGGIMTFDYQGFKLPEDKDVMLMYIEAWGNLKFKAAEEILKKNLSSSDYDIAKASSDALLKITGIDNSGRITAPKYRTDFDWAFIEKLAEKKFASVKTNRGIVRVVLNYKIAPFTVQNFVKLSEKGFYNNTVFHRVVPNFVIQGGDPTGTGYGGPGYSIRSELSSLPFDVYTIGMASSGKDTEGSQFFITHSPQPHLDGKYTIFGKVVDGFDVVDKIQIGDYIENISFSAER